MKPIDDYIKQLEKSLQDKRPEARLQNTGVVQEVKDGVTILDGLHDSFYGELVEFENGAKGFIIELLEDSVGVVVLGDYLGIAAGSTVRSLGKALTLPVGNDLLGRVVDSLANPLIGPARPKAKKEYPLERIAPGVIYRKSVSVPLATGIKAIDALIPIGRGQRELIIGDRATGKTTIAVDTIINQKNQDVICIYCSIGQKNAKVAAVVDTLTRKKAMDYSVIVHSSASDPAAAQYLAPYAAAAIAESFMDQGKDVLVIYDDLTKHAWAYRQISLILRRPAGREAYPGDVFYLHSRLLERSCRRDEKYGGGSITALPIIETLEGDVSGYIPTNVISITDGQIFLETELFNAGIRPALNIGISVSRVGGNAQTAAMKAVAGRLKLDLAQYRELAAFSQFESELDEETRKLLTRGAKVTEALKQKKHDPYSLAEQVCVLWAVTNGYLDQIPTTKVVEFEKLLLSELRSRGRELLKRINKEHKLEKKDETDLEKMVKKISTLLS